MTDIYLKIADSHMKKLYLGPCSSFQDRLRFTFAVARLHFSTRPAAAAAVALYIVSCGDGG